MKTHTHTKISHLQDRLKLIAGWEGKHTHTHIHTHTHTHIHTRVHTRTTWLLSLSTSWYRSLKLHNGRILSRLACFLKQIILTEELSTTWAVKHTHTHTHARMHTHKKQFKFLAAIKRSVNQHWDAWALRTGASKSTWRVDSSLTFACPVYTRYSLMLQLGGLLPKLAPGHQWGHTHTSTCTHSWLERETHTYKSTHLLTSFSLSWPLDATHWSFTIGRS